MHETLRDNSESGPDTILLLTNKHYYKLAPENYKIEFCKDLKDIHSLEAVYKNPDDEDEEDPNLFKICSHLAVSKNKASEGSDNEPHCEHS